MVAALAYWVGALCAMLRRPQDPAPSDFTWLRHGFLLSLGLATAVFFARIV